MKTEKLNKPFKTYNGGKEGNGTFQNIINYIPKCNRFIEVFAGNAAITRHIKRPLLTVINDLDVEVYQQLLSLESPSIIVENLGYEALIVKYDCKLLNPFFYFDPPYLMETRRSKQRLYKHDWTDEQHVKFLSMVVKVKSNCMISHYPCPMYDLELEGWTTFDFESSTRNGMRTERIYMNYPPPQILQDYSFLGKDFTERQQIKRKTQRLLDKLERLPHLERTALLSAVIGKYNHASAILLPPQ
jgi:DNA adenine methylase